MYYVDKVYGKVEISEPVILDLIKSPALQRLKKIDQAGYKSFWVKPDFRVNKNDRSRFAHSVGVYVLLSEYKAPLEEQIAGLLHDISHSAFSHCIDYVLESGSEKEHTHQDKIFAEFIKKSEIPKILKKYKLDLNYILDDNNFPLKEKDLPDLCADRIDYFFRDAVVFGDLNQNGVDYFLDNLIIKNEQWLFKNFTSAKKCAKLFLKLNTKDYSGEFTAAAARSLGDYLKYALQKKYISKKDLYTTDEAVLFKIGEHLKKDEKLNVLFKRMNRRDEFKNDPADYEARVFCKSRVVDPFCNYQGEIKRVSEIDLKWKEIIKNELKPKEYFIKFNDTLKEIHLLVSGKVQGVFYRVNAKSKADEIGLTGWVKNIADNKVEILAAGKEKDLKEFIAWCHNGSKSAEVDKIKTKWNEGKNKFDKFEILL